MHIDKNCFIFAKIKPMKVKITELKKGDKFFLDKEYTVIQKYFDWRRDGEPYLKATSGIIRGIKFYNKDLEVEKK